MELLLGVILINVLIFAFPHVLGLVQQRGDSAAVFSQNWWKDNTAIRSGEWYRLLTSTFLHSDILHLIFNMLALFQVGQMIVSIYNTSGFAMIYFISGIAGTFFSFKFNPLPSVGAGGGVFGLIGALLAFAIVSQNAGILLNVGFVVIANFALIFFLSRMDMWLYAAGFLAGFLLALGLIFMPIPVLVFK
jgi:rhomboid protease GluP